MTLGAAAVTITTVNSNSGTYLTFTAPRARVQPPKITLDDAGVLQVARGLLDDALVELKEAIPGMAVTDENAREVYRLLHQIGKTQMWTIFTSPRMMQALQDFWRSAMPFARNPKFSPPLVICAGAQGSMLPIEYLPLFDINPPDDVRDRAGLVRACRNIVGFSCVVQRSFIDLPAPQGTVMRPGTQGRVPVRFFYHEGLRGAERELEWFRDLSDYVDVVGPYPAAADGGPSLGAQIHNPALLLTGAPGPSADGVQHFACHCYATAAEPLENEISLRGSGQSFRVTLRTLLREVSSHFGEPGRPAEMPLVVMNACGASRMSSTGALSFPWFFLKNENRGFVGSNVEVPDDIAAEFAIAFYTRFIRQREPFGLAFHQARHHLLNRYGNPLGISYSAYGNPDLRIGEFPGVTHV